MDSGTYSPTPTAIAATALDVRHGAGGGYPFRTVNADSELNSLREPVFVFFKINVPIKRHRDIP